MRYTQQHSEETRKRVLDVAGRHFRSHGYGSTGVDGLVKAAGVTSGAFYGHFRSKADAFRAVVKAGLERLYEGVKNSRERRGSDWLAHFAAFYLGVKHRRDIAGGCALPILSSEVGRADPETRAVFEGELARIATLVSEGLPGPGGKEKAWPVLALLAGGTMLSRGVEDAAMAAEISKAVTTALERFVDHRERP